MNYTIVVPEPIQAEIASWNLSFDAEDALYAQLEAGLTQHALDGLWRLPGPGFVFVYNVELQDPLLLGITHSFTFWLVYTSEDYHLSIYQCAHDQTENWNSEEDFGGGEYDDDGYGDEPPDY